MKEFIKSKLQPKKWKVRVRVYRKGKYQICVWVEEGRAIYKLGNSEPKLYIPELERSQGVIYRIEAMLGVKSK